MSRVKGLVYHLIESEKEDRRRVKAQQVTFYQKVFQRNRATPLEHRLHRLLRHDHEDKDEGRDIVERAAQGHRVDLPHVFKALIRKGTRQVRRHNTCHRQRKDPVGEFPGRLCVAKRGDRPRELVRKACLDDGIELDNRP